MPADLYQACQYKGRDIYTMNRGELILVIKELTLAARELERPRNAVNNLRAKITDQTRVISDQIFEIERLRAEIKT